MVDRDGMVVIYGESDLTVALSIAQQLGAAIAQVMTKQMYRSELGELAITIEANEKVTGES